MFSSLRGFLNRHKKKFAVAGIIVGGTAIGLAYAQRRLREWQENETRKFLEMTRKKQHFESTEATCHQAITSLSPSVLDAVLKCLSNEEILERLRTQTKNKIKLWEDLKILTFARATSLIYASTILVITLRLQLNILGGYLYKDTINGNDSSKINGRLQQKYLSLCHHFVAEGIEKLCNEIQTKIQPIIEPLSLKQKMSLKDIEQVFWTIQSTLCSDNSDPLKQMITYLIDPKETTETDKLFKTILDETMDLLEWDDVNSLCVSSVSRGFSLLTDNIAEQFNTNKESKDVVANGISGGSSLNGHISKSHLNNFVNVNAVELPLAKIIPLINSFISQPALGMSDVFVTQLLANDKMKLLGSNVYDTFSS